MRWIRYFDLELWGWCLRCLCYFSEKGDHFNGWKFLIFLVGSNAHQSFLLPYVSSFICSACLRFTSFIQFLIFVVVERARVCRRKNVCAWAGAQGCATEPHLKTGVMAAVCGIAYSRCHKIRIRPPTDAKQGKKLILKCRERLAAESASTGKICE